MISLNWAGDYVDIKDESVSLYAEYMLETSLSDKFDK